MARYIDADALLENLKKQYGEELGWQCTVNMSDVGMMIDDAPTADVAPKSEVAREIFAEIAIALSDNFHADCQMGDCIEDYYDEDLRDDIAELENKYIGEQNDVPNGAYFPNNGGLMRWGYKSMG